MFDNKIKNNNNNNTTTENLNKNNISKNSHLNRGSSQDLLK